MKKIGCLVVLVVLGAVALVLLGGPKEPPSVIWMWGGDDGRAPASEADAHEVFDAPAGTRLLGFESRGEPADEGQPIGVALRAPPGIRSQVISLVGLGSGAPGPWRSYRATARSQRAQVGTFWQYVRTDAQPPR